MVWNSVWPIAQEPEKAFIVSSPLDRPETGMLEHPVPRSEMGPSLFQVGPVSGLIAWVAGVQAAVAHFVSFLSKVWRGSIHRQHS
jgi:hypothetical protein